MSLAENLLNSLDETAYQNTRIGGIVPEEHIKVGQDRVITVPNVLKTIAVKGDKDIETATIDCVRYWDGHDLSTFAIYLNYILPNGDEGTYIPEGISKAEDTFSFDWLIGSEFTYAQGKMTFWIVAKLTDDSGTLIKQWSSFQNSDCTIAQGGDKIYVPEKQTDQDVISQAISISRSSAGIAEQQANLAQQAAGKAASDARDAAEEEVSRIIGELGVVQELGDSPNSVVSQLKVTKEFNQTNAEVNRNSKRITNIEQGLTPDSFETDDSVAYQKDVPANALPYAAVQKVGGMTRKCENLLPFPYVLKSGTSAGVTITVNNDGSVKIVGTATADAFLKLADMDLGTAYIGSGNGNGKYMLSDCVYTGSKTVVIIISVGNSYDKTYYPMVQNDKATASPWEPYYEGLRSAKVTAVKSVGVNKYCGTEITEKTVGGFTYTWNETEQTISLNGTTSGVFETFIPLKHPIGLGGGTYTMKCEIMKNESTTSLLLGVCDWSNPYDTTNGYSNLASIGATKVYTFAQDANVNYIHIYGSSAGTFNAKLKVMLNPGSAALPCTPYVKRTLPIPEAVRPANGINENVYDYIEWAEDGAIKSHKRVGEAVFDGTEWWAYSADEPNPCFITVLQTTLDGTPALCSHFKHINFPYVLPTGTTGVFGWDSSYINLYFASGHTSVEEWKAYLAEQYANGTPVTVLYELAEPIVTDISDLITADNLIGVEGGGTLTFENEYGYAVPSEVEYQVEV